MVIRQKVGRRFGRGLERKTWALHRIEDGAILKYTAISAKLSVRRYE